MHRILSIALRAINLLIATLLTLLGYSSCEIGGRAMYGTPSAKYIVKGKVSSAKTGTGIENIQVIMRYDTTLTDQNGDYLVSQYDFPIDNTVFDVSVSDPDSTLHGSYQSKDTTVTFLHPVFKGGDGEWYSGEASEDLNIQLNPKE